MENEACTQVKYNRIIEAIEESFSTMEGKDSVCLGHKKIGEEAFLKAGLEGIDIRSRNEIFKFLTGMTLQQYISYRSMMFLYKKILDGEVSTIDELVTKSGLSSESALDKKFREYFHMTPKDAIQRKIITIYREPSYWKMLSTTGKEHFEKTIEVVREVPVEKRVFDKRPLKILALILPIILVIVFCGIKQIQFHEKWAGNYLIYKCPEIEKLLEEGINIENMPEKMDIKNDIIIGYGGDAYIEIYPFQKKAVVRPGYGSDLIIDIHSFNDNKMIWSYKEDTDTHEAIREEDGSISTTFFYKDRYCKHRFIKNRVFDEWDNRASGYYRPQFGFEGAYLPVPDDKEPNMFVVSYRLGLVYLMKGDKEIWTGYIDYFDGDSFTVVPLFDKDAGVTPITFRLTDDLVLYNDKNEFMDLINYFVLGTFDIDVRWVKTKQMEGIDTIGE